MKESGGIYLLILIILFAMLSGGCKKDEPPVLTTTELNDITTTTATSGGIVTYEGSSRVIARGVCWSTSPNPTIDNSKTSDSSGIGNFNSSITELSPGTIYYVRAYATNRVATGYGNEISFTTKSVFDLFPLKVGNEYYYKYDYWHCISILGSEYFSAGKIKWTILTDSLKNNMSEYYFEEKFNGIDVVVRKYYPGPAGSDTTIIKDRIRYFRVIENPSALLSLLIGELRLIGQDAKWNISFKRYHIIQDTVIYVGSISEGADYYFQADSGMTKYLYHDGPNTNITYFKYILDSVKISH